MKKHYDLMSVSMRLIALTLVFCSTTLLTSCSKDDDNSTSTEISFEEEMTAALADAQKYGPATDAFAREVAARFDGCVTDINYKTRESATRKCITDNCRPYDLKDLARTTIVAGWDSIEIKPVIDYLVTTSTERGFFGRYKHQTSDYGYWGDIVNLQYDKLMTEVQVKTYGMFYAVHNEAETREVIGDSLYNIIRTKSGVEPGMSHYYYEIMRADTSSAATVEYYRQLSIQYYACFEHLKDSVPEDKAPKIYYMTVDATKGFNEAASRDYRRVLSLDGSTLTPSWATSENVYVQGTLKSDGITKFWFEGSIKPQTAGTSTRLNGTISLPKGWTISIDEAISNPHRVTLQFPRQDFTYEGQNGTLADIAANYDYALAENVRVDIAADKVVGVEEVTFVNQQAIVKFTLIDKANGTTKLNPSALSINYGSGLLELTSIPDATYSTNGSGVLYVAIPGFSEKAVTLTATCSSGTYSYTKSNVTFQNGKYYDITVKMTKQQP